MSKIYFIGGAPRSGKTTAIRELIKQLPILAASTDAIRNVAKGVTSPTENQKLHKIDAGDYSSEVYRLKMKSDPASVLELENKQSEEVWKSTLDFIGYYQRDGIDAAIEGVAVLPKALAKLEFDYSAIFLVPKDDPTDAIINNALKNKDDWLHKYDEVAIRAFCDFNKYWNEYYQKEATSYGFKIVAIDYENFEFSIKEAISILLNK